MKFDEITPLSLMAKKMLEVGTKLIWIRVTRNPLSLQYKRNPNAKGDWSNNDFHNCMDTFEVFEGETVIYSVKVQSVSNMEGLDVATAESPASKFMDTIAPGSFQLKVGLDKTDPRNFYGRINGICNAKTLAGDVIKEDCTTDKNKARWLNHDRQKHKPNPKGIDTRMCWSAGCFVFWNQSDLEGLGKLFDTKGFNPGDKISGELIMSQ